MQTFEVWAEGFRATGDAGQAHLVGVAEAETFMEAVRKVAATKSLLTQVYFNFSGKQPYFWGCRLFDNERDARKSFG